VEELVDAVAGVAGDDAVALGLDDALDDVSDLAARSAEESEKGEGKDVRRKGIDQHNDPGQGELRRSRVVMVEESWEGVEGRKEGRKEGGTNAKATPGLQAAMASRRDLRVVSMRSRDFAPTSPTGNW
jgi:hypothetical protein